MIDTKKEIAEDILQKEDAHSVAVRQNMARQMSALGYGALLWSENVFGSTNYPLITAPDGSTYNVHGLRLNNEGGVCAIIDYPTKEYITGVKAYTSDEASKLISPAMLICSGLPEEWDILGDCFSTAIQIMKTEKGEEQPLPWW
ncbi:MAG: hypothetical protein NC402_05100 [Prevotella sp.]|nr:hypothetical protein [Prevotella sp.]MCM1074122.1 hypothetical protein [Ruminococcus sp.]